MVARWFFATIAALALSACDRATPGEEPAAPAEQQTPAPPALPAAAPRPPVLTPEEEAALGNRDCRVVAEAYLGAIERSAFEAAAEFWDDPVIDGERLAALYSGYLTPRIDLTGIQEEGAAGSLYCTVSGTLGDSSDPRTPSEPGEIVLRRVNDVPGASPDQLRWTVRSSSFVEPMERSGRGG